MPSERERRQRILAWYKEDMDMSLSELAAQYEDVYHQPVSLRAVAAAIYLEPRQERSRRRAAPREPPNKRPRTE